jgi:Ca2+-binding RTX toxin-like protein
MTDRSAAFGISNITAMVADPTSSYVYFATSTGYVYKWNADTGTTVLSAQVGTDLTSIALSADHSYLVTGEANGTTDQPLRFEKIAVSDLSSTSIQVPVATTYPADALESYRYGVYSLALTPDNQVIYNASYALSGATPVGEFSVSDPENVNYTAVSEELSSGTLITSENGRYDIVADQYASPSDITIYDTQTGITTQTPFDYLRGAVYGTASISGVDGLIAYDDTSLRVLDLTGHLVQQITDYRAGGYLAQATAFVPSGRYLLVWDTTNNLLRAYDTQTWAQVGAIAMPAFVYGGTAPNIVVGDSGQFLYLNGNRQSIDLAARLPIVTSQTFALTTGADDFQGGPGTNTFVATTKTLSRGDVLVGGTGINVLELQGGGLFDLRTPATLSNISTVTATEGAGAARPTVDLRNGLDVTLDVASGTGVNPGITIHGANDASTINLGNGTDTVTVGGVREIINGGAGKDTIDVTGATIGATITGGAGATVVDVSGGGTAVMGANITNIQTVKLEQAAHFTANGLSGLTIIGSSGADTITAGGARQTLTGDGGADTLIGYVGGGDTFSDTASHLGQAAIQGFVAGDVIDITNLRLSKTVATTVSWASGVLTITQGATTDHIALTGSFTGAFAATSDGKTGVDITYAPAAAAMTQAMAGFGAGAATAQLVAMSDPASRPMLLSLSHAA